MNVNPELVEVLRVWYSVFCTVVDAHVQGDYSEAQLVDKLVKLRVKLAKEVPEVEQYMIAKRGN